MTLDDNRASQADAALLLQARGMRGTFYVNSGRILGMAGYLTYAQLQQIQAAGHEVGGHHPLPSPASPRWTWLRNGTRSATTGWP